MGSGKELWLVTIDGQLAGMEMAKAITFKRVPKSHSRDERVFDYSKAIIS